MNDGKIMAWIDHLPSVGKEVLNYRDALQSGIDEAIDLERQAAAIRAEIKKGQDSLMASITRQWTLFDIETASKRHASSVALSGRQMMDPGLQKAVMALDGNVGPGGALEIYEREVLRDQAEHLKNGSPETVAILTRLIEWWVYAGAPALKALRG
jgi:hypothetical protein